MIDGKFVWALFWSLLFLIGNLYLSAICPIFGKACNLKRTLKRHMLWWSMCSKYRHYLGSTILQLRVAYVIVQREVNASFLPFPTFTSELWFRNLNRQSLWFTIANRMGYFPIRSNHQSWFVVLGVPKRRNESPMSSNPMRSWAWWHHPTQESTCFRVVFIAYLVVCGLLYVQSILFW